MSLFSAAEIAQLRADQEASFPDTIDVITVTRVPDGMGGWTDSESGTATVPCRIQPALRIGTEGVQGSGVYGLSDVLVGMPYDTVVTPTSLLRRNGSTYQAKSVRAPRSYQYAVWVDATLIS